MLKGRALGALLLVTSATSTAALQPRAAPVPHGRPVEHDIRPGAGVRTVSLSAYLPSLRGTPGDTPIFLLEGKRPGGTVLVAGGTHANEIAGVFAATLLIERARPLEGRLLVIPHANNAATGRRDPERPVPEWITVAGPRGARRFRFGSRLTDPRLQGAVDPLEYKHPGGERKLPGHEARNLDRAYPGRADGTLTERIACAITTLMRREAVDVAFDIHEAPPDSRLAWMIVAHPRGLDLAALAVVELDAAGLPIKLETSDAEFRGLSHREWGDATTAYTFLIETPNPNQLKGGGAFDPVNHPEYPLARRVGAQLEAILAVLAAYDGIAPAGRAVRLENVPRADELGRRGVGAFLN